MGSIRLLDDALADQIAAGEVVERPASVVKELLDNAIDAKSKVISVEISEGGRDLIRVSDDGVGMDREDALMCVRRHATSKLRQFADLSALTTMGFRGEALASISSVSRFRLVTCQEGALAGTEIRIEGGAEAQVRDIGAPRGTTVEVKELFYNVPARRKFLKARQTETHHVGEACLRTALAHPAIRLSFVSNARRVREYLPAEDRSARARAIFNDQPLLDVDGAHDGVALHAVLGGPERARAGARHLYLFVNGRPVVDRALARSVAFAYGDALEMGRYPAGVVFVELPPAEVDVNAHPQKTEVRFARASRVFDAVTRIVAKGLGTRSWGEGITGSVAAAKAPETSGPAARSADFWKERLAPGPSVEGKDRWGLATALKDDPGTYDPVSETPAKLADDAEEGPPAPEPSVPPLRVFGRVGSLWLAASRELLWAVDPQRAAASVVSMTWGESIPAQRLRFPERVEVDANTASAIESAIDALIAMGVECTAVGEGTIAIHTLPTLGPLVRATLDPPAVLDAALRALESDPAERAKALAHACCANVEDACAAAVIDRLHQEGLLESVARAWPASDLRP
ncbi:MAG: DNA mismatch repair endonuclease MutL [Myxococcota bacterium]